MDLEILDRLAQRESSVSNYLLLDAVDELMAAASGDAPMSIGAAYLRVQMILDQRWRSLAEQQPR